MNLKLEAIRKAAIPLRTVKQLDRIVQNYKPVSDHKHNVRTWHSHNCPFLSTVKQILIYCLDRVRGKKEG